MSPLDWAKDRRRHVTWGIARGVGEALPVHADADRPDTVVFEVEWPDGLILGVIEIAKKRHYARYDRTARRWTRRLLPWQVERIDAQWASHLDDTMFAPDQEEPDAERTRQRSDPGGVAYSADEPPYDDG